MWSRRWGRSHRKRRDKQMEVWPTFWGEGRPRPGREGATTCPGRPAPHCGRGSERESRPQCTRDGGAHLPDKARSPQAFCGVSAGRPGSPSRAPPLVVTLPSVGPAPVPAGAAPHPLRPLLRTGLLTHPPASLGISKQRRPLQQEEERMARASFPQLERKKAFGQGAVNWPSRGRRRSRHRGCPLHGGRPHRICDVTDTRAASAGNAALPWTWQPAPWPSAASRTPLGTSWPLWPSGTRVREWGIERPPRSCPAPMCEVVSPVRTCKLGVGNEGPRTDTPGLTRLPRGVRHAQPHRAAHPTCCRVPSVWLAAPLAQWLG